MSEAISLFRENRLAVPCNRERLVAALRECVAPDERTSTLSDTPKPLIGTIRDDSFSVYTRLGRYRIEMRGDILSSGDDSALLRFRFHIKAFWPLLIIGLALLLFFIADCIQAREPAPIFFILLWETALIVLSRSLARRAYALLDAQIEKAVRLCESR